jgi:hypothetical protein
MVEPAGFPPIPVPPDFLRTIGSVLARMAGNRNAITLNLVARPNPETGEIRYWSSELNFLFPPIPAGSPSGWSIRAALPDAGEKSPEVLLWQTPLMHENAAVTPSPVDKDRILSVFPEDRPGSFLSRPDNAGRFVEVSGPLPPEIPADSRPEMCWLDIRWPASTHPEEERTEDKEAPVSPRESGAVPFRLELSYGGGRLVVVGGVYEPSPRTLSLSVRTGDDGIRAHWEKMQKDLSRDLAEVLSIRLSGTPGQNGKPE